MATSADKWRISVFSGLIFLFVSAPFLYSITSSIAESIGLPALAIGGCPTELGLIVHAIVFILITRLVMEK